MHVCCLDLEGVLIPEIWIAVAKKFGINDLSLTTRDIPDYDKLMRFRIRVLDKENIMLADIQRVIRCLKPLPGAATFLKKLKRKYPVIIISDTFYEFAGPLMDKLGNPTLFCNWLKVSKSGKIIGYQLRQRDGKRKAVRALKSAGFKVKASGDSYNDLTMIREAEQGVLFRPPRSIAKKFPKIPVAQNYETLIRLLSR